MTSTLPKRLPVLICNRLVMIWVGCRRDSTKAGYPPAVMPTKLTRSMRKASVVVLRPSLMDRDLSARLLNVGNVISAMAMPMMSAMKMSKRDSPINWFAICMRPAPTTFRKPTSRARVACRPRVRVMKLTQAINRTRIAMPDRMYE